tara:strand:+ start:170 stop:355 length:186 start_codon:yes stop_codon:yes gene_type:complete
MVKYTLTEALKIMNDISRQYPVFVAVFTGDNMSILEDVDHIVQNGDAIQIGVYSDRLVFDE